jgi:hypothetical protein
MSSLFVDSPECIGLPYRPTTLQTAKAYDAFQKRMAQEFPGAWPWPVSGMAKPKPQAFDTEAHRNFMRGLG